MKLEKKISRIFFFRRENRKILLGWVQGRWSLDAIEIDLRIFTGCNLDRDSFLSSSYLLEMGLFYLTEVWVFWYLRGLRVVAVDVKYNRVQVEELCLETMVDFKGGEYYDNEEAAVFLRYEKLFGHCKLCASLCHKEELCPLDDNNLKSSPERRRELREGNGAWTDGTKHEDRARSYKGVVINGQPGQQNKERDNRENYGKGK